MLLRYFAGVVPTTALNVLMKCEWSKNPTSAAMSATRRSVVRSKVFALLMRTVAMDAAGAICIITENRRRNCAGE